jgi:hypothetical protein
MKVSRICLAWQFQKALPDDLREIEAAISQITVQGDRYPESLQQMTGR